jgi:hypothetical protein
MWIVEDSGGVPSQSLAAVWWVTTERDGETVSAASARIAKVGLTSEEMWTPQKSCW